MKRIYITVPNHKGWLHKRVHFVICGMLADRRYQVRHDAPTHSPYVDNLHACMNDFLNGGEDFWLSMDDDNPPMQNPLDLVELDLDVVGLPTPVWYTGGKQGESPWYLNALDRVHGGWVPVPQERRKGLQEVDAIGSGCFMVARRVMEALKDDQPFMRIWGKDGRVEVGTDYAFCDRVRAKGFRIWAHFDYVCQHFCEVELIEAIQKMGESYGN